MKTPLLTLLMIIIFLSAGFSQKVKIGLTAGPVLVGTTRENVQISNDDTLNHTRVGHSILSYFGGVLISVPLSNKLMFRPQAEYIVKGAKNHFNYADNAKDFDTKLKAKCIDLKLNFLYNIPTKNGRFLLGAGPYLSNVLSGDLHNEKSNTTKKLVFNSTDTTGVYVHRTDIGVNVIVEYEFRNGLFCSLNYSYGFRDFRIEETASSNSNKNTALGLGIGYIFK